MPLQRRIPKRGFTPRKRHVYQIVNVGDLARVEGATVNAQTLRDAGLIRSVRGLIKVLAMGDVTQAYSVEAHKFSGGAAAKIEAAGGSVTTVGPAVAVDPPAAAIGVDPPDSSAEVADADPPVATTDADPLAADTDADPPAVDVDATAEPAEAENDG